MNRRKSRRSFVANSGLGNAFGLIILFLLFLLTHCKEDSTSNDLASLLLAPTPGNVAGGTNPLFIDHGNGTASVPSRGLLWTKCPQAPVGNRYDPATGFCDGGFGRFSFCSVSNGCGGPGQTIPNPLPGGQTSEAFNSCNNLTLAGKDWRMPTKNEFALFFYEVYLADNHGYFAGAYEAGPATIENRYWTSTSGSPTNAWTVDGFGGLIDSEDKVEQLLIRCVSDL